MKQRAIIHVGGPPGAGKTTLVEHLFRGTDQGILAARCRRDDSLRRPREASPKTDLELRRYPEAGADGAAVFTFPAGDLAADEFYTTRLMEEYSRAVVLEGDSPWRLWTCGSTSRRRWIPARHCSSASCGIAPSRSERRPIRSNACSANPMGSSDCSNR